MAALLGELMQVEAFSKIAFACLLFCLFMCLPRSSVPIGLVGTGCHTLTHVQPRTLCPARHREYRHPEKEIMASRSFSTEGLPYKYVMLQGS